MWQCIFHNINDLLLGKKKAIGGLLYNFGVSGEGLKTLDLLRRESGLLDYFVSCRQPLDTTVHRFNISSAPGSFGTFAINSPMRTSASRTASERLASFFEKAICGGMKRFLPLSYFFVRQVVDFNSGQGVLRIVTPCEGVAV